MADPKNIKFKVGEEAAFQLKYNPKEIIPDIDPNDSIFILHDGVEVTNHISNIVRFELIWEPPAYMDNAQYKILYELWFLKTSFYIYPDPLNHPDLCWLVKFKGGQPMGINKSATGQLDGWGWHGKIILIGAQAETEEDLSDDWEFGSSGLEGS